jgi:recombinational DNA repair protein (RecF pathway)
LLINALINSSSLGLDGSLVGIIPKSRDAVELWMHQKSAITAVSVVNFTLLGVSGWAPALCPVRCGNKVNSVSAKTPAVFCSASPSETPGKAAA